MPLPINATQQASSRSTEVAMAKRFTNESAMSAAHECVRMLGSSSLLASNPMDRVLRDLRACAAIGGTNEVMAVAVYAGMSKAPGES